MHVDLDLLETFVVLVQHRHYGRTAAIRHLTPPTVSKQIQRLERQVGARLLERGPSGVLALTQAGVRLAAHAAALLDRERALQRATRGEVTSVVLGSPADGEGGASVADVTVLQRILRRRLPEVALVCQGTPLPMITTWLLEGRVDVQLTAGVVPLASVCSIPLAAVPRVAVVSAHSPLGDAASVHVNDLVQLPMLYDPGLPDEFMRPFWLGDLRPASEAHLTSIVARDSRTVLEQVVRATGVSVVLEAQKDTVPDGVRVLSLLGAAPVLIYAATRANDRRLATHALVEALCQVLAHPEDGSTGSTGAGRGPMPVT